MQLEPGRRKRPYNDEQLKMFILANFAINFITNMNKITRHNDRDCIEFTQIASHFTSRTLLVTTTKTGFGRTNS